MSQHPEMKPVTSSQIESVGYDADAKELHVRFHRGGHYAYSAEPHEHEALIGAKSVGSHFIKNIKGRAFRRLDK